ncbi:class I SAM-dependent RNA methyltransferase [Mesobacterium sp. TK19101]|uniref:Class I SAM-dependent RNA methyltransferase n=1 Tax=Mesobacterium hydrothermale TaxID=3111907 RepID=A0ABU6HL02_9RHOB|nr:class I SAM-dependent RNA methyltransferase [Mesobacterium sp. TK19101]MEC3863133.1 class I SAM-dependent RNA methyltransferase [Mesobacterium sp. TK19101]
MTTETDLEIFIVATPGLEPALLDEVREAGFAGATQGPGGITFRGGWPDVWRANLVLRGATRVLVRIGAFRAFHLAQLDKRARKFPWGDVLRKDVPIKVEVTCKASKIYHAGAAQQRIERAITETLGAQIAADAGLVLKVRIDDNLVTFSVDSSGESLHKRGHKQAVSKAPMRETLAALFLRQMGFDGSQSVVDPMCGSGTFLIEAAEIAAGLNPGRSRSFAFENLSSFDATTWAALKTPRPLVAPSLGFFGSDRDDGAIRSSETNAKAAGVSYWCQFTRAAVSDLTPPDTRPGIVIVNPPYGERIGNKKLLFGLYGALGATLKERFSGWSVGIVTTDAGLVKATGLPILPPGPPVAHGGLKVRLFRTAALK